MIVRRSIIHHPWKLFGYKILWYALNSLPFTYERRLEYKKKIFLGKFAKFSREKFRVYTKGNIDVYDLGLFKICIINNSSYFPINNLEMNLAYEFLDIVYPSINSMYLNLILGEGPYETGDVLCEKGDYVVDSGASLGVFSSLSSIRVGDSGHVFAIEPVEFFVKCMEESLEVNTSKNISLLQFALGDQEKEDVVYLCSENPGESSLNIKTSQWLPVRQVTLDSLIFKRKQIPRVDFLKMDIEGSERSALLGARETIFRFRPRLSICTYHLEDDPIVLSNIIMSINPNYRIRFGKKKLYARV